MPRIFAVCLLLAACSRGSDPAPSEPEPARNAPVAVVELFTSEGCSSCPPADEHLIEIVERAKTEGRAIHALSFHVDYWNDLGWRDPFSDAAYSERQRRYGERLGSGRVYTPQLVVNGSEEHLGSNRAAAREAIDRALERPAPISIQIRASRAHGAIAVSWELSPPLAGALLNLALTRGARAIAVTRGENAGRTLSHANVVRAFETVKGVPARGSTALPLPRDVAPESAAVVAFVQDERTLSVLGATSAAL